VLALAVNLILSFSSRYIEVSLDINTKVASLGTAIVNAILREVVPFLSTSAVISADDVPLTFAIINELILRILLEAERFVTIAVGVVVTASPLVFPKIEVTFTMLGFAIFIPYPNTIAIAIDLPVVIPTDSVVLATGPAKLFVEGTHCRESPSS